MLKNNTYRVSLASAMLCVLLTACAAPKSSGETPVSAPAVSSKPSAPPVVFSAGPVDAASTEIRIALADGETALLSSLPDLCAADLSGSQNEEEVALWARAHPEIETFYTVTMPDGAVLDSGTRSYDMSALPASDFEETARRLSLLPELKTVNLGDENGAIGWDAVARLREVLPDTTFRYGFTLYGKELDLSSSSINLSHIPVEDSAEALRRVIPCMSELGYVDMDSCGVSNAEMEKLCADFPDIRFVWRVWFGSNYSVRTDVQRIIASKPSAGGMIYDWDAEALSCCHDVVFLDLGHNRGLTDISFVARMPKLEVAILAMCDWTDASPLASCPELEYLEMQSTQCGDLTPLASLSNLRHLNIAGNYNIEDISPLYDMTQLKRLWLGSMHRVPDEQVEEFRRRLPDCELDTLVYDDPTGGRWRWDEDGNMVERYYLLRMQFGYYEEKAFSYTWNDEFYE